MSDDDLFGGLNDAMQDSPETATTAFSPPPEDRGRARIAAELRDNCFAVRVPISKFGEDKALTKAQREKEAEVHGADASQRTSGKKLVDTRNPAYKRVREIQKKAVQYFEAVCIPSPERGIRFCPGSRLEELCKFIETCQIELEVAKVALQQSFNKLKEQQRQKLKKLFCAEDYPEDITDRFSIGLRVVNVEPPAQLAEVSPELYRQEKSRVTQTIQGAIAKTERTLAVAFHKAVARLVNRLTPDETGKRPGFKRASIDNLRVFFRAFKRLNLGSSSELEALVRQAEYVVGKLVAAELRKDIELQEKVRSSLAPIAESMERFVEEKL